MIDCQAPTTLDQLAAEMAAVDAAMADQHPEAAPPLANALEATLQCLGEPVRSAQVIAHVDRAIGYGKWVAGDRDGAKRWYGAAYSVEPTFAYGSELPPGDTLREFVDQIASDGLGDAVSVGTTMAPGTWRLDGSTIRRPAATPGVPHLLQRDDGTTAQTWLIEGSEFPKESVGASVEVASSPPALDQCPKGMKMGPNGICEATKAVPKERYPLIIGGGLAGLGAAGLYLAAADARNDFDNANNLEEVESAKDRTNGLVLASAATLAVGAGTLTWGVAFTNGGPGIVLRH